MGVPLAGAFVAGAGSVSLVYGHVLVFDYLRCMGYSNVEVISHRTFAAVPALRYLIYTPTYVRKLYLSCFSWQHSIHLKLVCGTYSMTNQVLPAHIRTSTKPVILYSAYDMRRATCCVLGSCACNL